MSASAHRCTTCGHFLVDVVTNYVFVEDKIELPAECTLRAGCFNCERLLLVSVVRQLYAVRKAAS